MFKRIYKNIKNIINKKKLKNMKKDFERAEDVLNNWKKKNMK